MASVGLWELREGKSPYELSEEDLVKHLPRPALQRQQDLTKDLWRENESPVFGHEAQIYSFPQSGLGVWQSGILEDKCY